MTAKLDRLLHDIDPIRVLDPVNRSVDEAINSFPINTTRMKDWMAVKMLLACLFMHIEYHALSERSRPDVDPEFTWDRCCQALKKVYGSDAQYEIMQSVLSGTGGGLRSVIRNLGYCMAEEYARNEINARVAQYWSGLSLDEKLADSKAYLATWGHMLPLVVREDGAARLRAYFPQYLQEHPFVLLRLRTAGRVSRS